MASSPDDDARRRRVFLLALVAPVFVLRAFLAFAPDADFNVAGHNVHHLFTGLLLVAAGGIPLAVARLGPIAGDLAAAAFGAGLGLALDEWVYLIATDGSNSAYLLPVSFWGACVMIGLAVAWAELSSRLGR